MRNFMGVEANDEWNVTETKDYGLYANMLI